MQFATRFVTVTAGLGVLLSCSPEVSTDRPAEATPPELAEAPAPPDHDIVHIRDLSMGAVRRLEVRVSLSEHYGRDAVEQVAKAIVEDITSSESVNAISVLFYGPSTATTGAYDVAMVEWAPMGRWADAGSVRSGDYATFRYSVSYNPPVETPTTDAPRLVASGRTGLLDAPLPEGATLIERTPGDVDAGRDPSERYSIAVSPEEIIAFFIDQMPSAGWIQDGPARPTSVFFQKGNLAIGVLTRRDGGTFTLMGS